MGIHASPYVMNFDNSISWKVEFPQAYETHVLDGESGRLATRIMGLGLAEIAYQNSLLGLRMAEQGSQGPDPNEVLIISSPDGECFSVQGKQRGM